MAREIQSPEGDNCSPSSFSVIKFLCSYGGKIVPRKSDGKLCYVGGFTRILSVDRSVSYTELMVKLVEFCGFSVVLRCQLPGGDLETLITIKSDEDLANLVEEYEKAGILSSQKIRAVLSPPGSPRVASRPSSSASSVDSSGNNSPLHVASNPSRFRSRSPSPPVETDSIPFP
ncbi:hypothetical protein MLD38_021869 [Melastoma candidum]|uniref:Uncharacterized protein n=1 Tax=Melastoma candidum TaxID=119954 RepID=A0ACB9QKD5_9MYRT|nr:hypothetical protein MLD38_021869 [Melastoma candidum]